MKLSGDKSEQRRLWIGLVTVHQPDGVDILGDAEGAYTNAIGVATSRSTFRASIKVSLQSMNLELVRLENAEPYNERLNKSHVDEELRKLARAVRRSGGVAFGTFHSY